MSRELHRVRAQGSGKSLVTLWSRQPQSQIKLNSKEKDQQPYRLFTEREIQMVPNHVKNAHPCSIRVLRPNSNVCIPLGAHQQGV